MDLVIRVDEDSIRSLFTRYGIRVVKHVVLLHRLLRVKYVVGCGNSARFCDLVFDTSLLEVLRNGWYVLFCLRRGVDVEGIVCKIDENVPYIVFGGKLRGVDVLSLIKGLYVDLVEEFGCYRSKVFRFLRSISLSSILRMFMIPHLSPVRRVDVVRKEVVDKLGADKLHAISIIEEVVGFSRDALEFRVLEESEISYPMLYALERSGRITVFDLVRGIEDRRYVVILERDQGYRDFVVNALRAQRT
ncbi:MAG: hypothetical protein DRJ40_07190 [Thermoprotei archaeon]|nr:MAG: hypothetical protein DRJ40_07190 [Thermoprotei archaeon]